MSILSGLVGHAGIPGRIDLQDTGTPVVYFRGLGIDSSGRICCKAAIAGAFYKDGFLYANDAATSICYEVGGVVDHHIGGIPCTAAGAIAIEDAEPVTFVHGVGITASGRLAFV